MKNIGSKISAVIICCSCMAVIIIGSVGNVKGTALVRSDTEEKLLWMAREYSSKFSTDLEIIEEKVDHLEVYVKDTIDTDKLRTDRDYLSEYAQEAAPFFRDFAIKHTDGVATWCYFNPKFSDKPHDIYYADGDRDGIPERQKHIPLEYYDNTPTPTDDKQWWYGTVEKGSGYWTNPYEWKLKNDEIIKVTSYAKPVIIDGELIAVVGTYYLFEDMYKEIMDINVYESGYVALYNEELDVVIHPRYYAGTRFNSDNLMTVENGKYRDSALRILANESGVDSYTDAETGEESLFAYSRLSNGWVMTVNPATREIFAGLDTLLSQLLAAELVCIVISLIVALFAGKIIAKPILKVAQGAKMIEKGDFDVVIDVNTKDEIKVLAESINKMAHSTGQLQQELERLAFCDDLTGGLNLHKFKLKATDILSANPNKSYYIMRMDIDAFKLVNDMYGYDEGDIVLKNTHRAIAQVCHGEAVCARVASDDFVMLALYRDDDCIIESIREVEEGFNQLCKTQDKAYKITFTTGVYRIPYGETDISSIVDRSKMAHKRAKTGENQRKIFFYNQQIRDEAIRAKIIEDAMYGAMESGEFKVFLQPKFDLRTNKIMGAEALIRWVAPSSDRIKSPTEFIPIFEKNGFVANIDMFVLEQVCKAQRRWMDMGISPVPISVNQSKVLLLREGYVEGVIQMVSLYNVPPELIELEIVETLMHENIEELRGILASLNEAGFLISIDDFGSGYSSLNMLKDIEADVLKIDREFLNRSEENKRGEIVLSNIIRLAKELNMSVVTEGVETEKQADMLRRLNCDTAQGYLYARPMPMDTYEQNYMCGSGEAPLQSPPQ